MEFRAIDLDLGDNSISLKTDYQFTGLRKNSLNTKNWTGSILVYASADY